MAQQVGKYAANKLLKKQMKAYQGKGVESGNDPYFAMVENPRKPGKFKKVKKQIPAYIPEHDANILASVRKSAYRLDMCLFNFLGIRFGWEAVIGIVPALGDAIGVLFALMVYRKCTKIDGGLDSSIKLRMMLNIIADFTVGLIPFLGDIADAAFKCNTRNLRLLEVVLDKKYKPQQGREDERDHAGVDKEKRRKNRASGIFHHNDPPPATAFEEFSDDELREQEHEYRHPDQGRAPQGGRQGGAEMAQTRPPPVHAQETGTVRH